MKSSASAGPLLHHINSKSALCIKICYLIVGIDLLATDTS